MSGSCLVVVWYLSKTSIKEASNDSILKSILLVNRDTKKQLLDRSSHLLYKSQYNWTEDQKERTSIYF